MDVGTWFVKNPKIQLPKKAEQRCFLLGQIECLSIQYVYVYYIYGKRKDYALLCQEFGSYRFFLEVKDWYVGSMDTNLDFVDEIYVGEDRISYRVGYRG